MKAVDHFVLDVCTFLVNTGETSDIGSKNLKVRRIDAPHRPPSSYLPRPLPDHQTLKSLRVEGVSHPKIVSDGSWGAYACENSEFAGETSSLESPKIQKIGESVPILFES